jgi:Ca2+-binding RTX toxin-like protein
MFEASLPFDPATLVPGVRVVGRTLHVKGFDDDDTIRVSPAPTTNRPSDIRVQLANRRLTIPPTLFPGGLDRFVLNGGAGNDVIIFDTGLPDAFHPRVVILRGGPGNDTIVGSDRADRILGEDGNDTINGGVGNDLIDGGTGNDTINGGGGNDTANRSDLTDRYRLIV